MSDPRRAFLGQLLSRIVVLIATVVETHFTRADPKRHDAGCTVMVNFSASIRVAFLCQICLDEPQCSFAPQVAPTSTLYNLF